MISRILVITVGVCATLSQPVWAQEISISSDDCQKLLSSNRHLPADYTPNVDFRGNALKPVDIDTQNRLGLPSDIKFDLNVDLIKRYWPDAAEKGISGAATLGEIIVKGRSVFWNGKKLSQIDKNTVTAECAKTYQK